MCLIIAGKAAKIRDALLNTEGMLLSIFKSNPDGIGVMYATKHKDERLLKVVKKLPNSLEQARDFISRMPDDTRQCAIHFRWTTHGHTDLENCHPYTVLENQVALMHNGVLSTGNSKDTSKSDTWHFIEDYLKEAVKMAPGLVFDPGFIALVKDFIGTNNRFVFMGADGRMTIVNKKEGIEHDGLWFSNTYAWSPAVFIDGYKSGWNGSTYYQPTRSRSYHNGFEGMDDDEYDWRYGMGGSWSGSGGAQSGSNKSGGVVHNTPSLPSAAPSSSAPAPSAASPVVQGGAKADEEEQAEWERTVRAAHNDWLRDGGREDPPEEGQASGASQRGVGEIVKVNAPTRAELIEALTDSNTSLFDQWLAAYPQVTIGLLFHLYKPEPVTFHNPQTDLTAFERYLHNRFMAHDKQALIEECRRSDGSASVVSELICYYLNWRMWPEAGSPFPVSSRPDLITPAPTPAPAAAPTDSGSDPVEISSAQLGQGGESV